MLFTIIIVMGLFSNILSRPEHTERQVSKTGFNQRTSGKTSHYQNERKRIAVQKILRALILLFCKRNSFLCMISQLDAEHPVIARIRDKKAVIRVRGKVCTVKECHFITSDGTG